MNFFLEGLNPFGFSEDIEPGLLPWKIYFSDLGIEVNVFGGRWKFSLSTDFGVCASTYTSMSVYHIIQSERERETNPSNP